MKLSCLFRLLRLYLVSRYLCQYESCSKSQHVWTFPLDVAPDLKHLFIFNFIKSEPRRCSSRFLVFANFVNRGWTSSLPHNTPHRPCFLQPITVKASPLKQLPLIMISLFMTLVFFSLLSSLLPLSSLLSVLLLSSPFSSQIINTPHPTTP